MVSRRIIAGGAVVSLATAVFAAAAPAYANPNYVLTTGNGGTVSSASGSIAYTATQTDNLHLYDTTGATTNLECLKSSTVGNNSSVSGNVTRGAQAGPTVGTIGNSTWGTATYSSPNVTAGANTCTAVAGSVPVAVVHNGTWSLNIAGVSSGTAHPPALPVAGQVTPGTITGISAKVYVGKTNPCTFEVGGIDPRTSPNNTYTTPGNPVLSSVPTGSVSGTYSNSALTGYPNTGTLTVGLSAQNLYAWNVNPSSGCAGGAIKNGDKLTFAGINATTPAAYAVSATTSTNNAIWIDS